MSCEICTLQFMGLFPNEKYLAVYVMPITLHVSYRTLHLSL